MDRKRSREERERAEQLPPPPPRPAGRPVGRPINHYLPQPPRGPPLSRARVQSVDREKTCPLLRVFTKVGGHHTSYEVKEVSPTARRRDAKLSFATVYPDKKGHMQLREAGQTFSNPNKRLDDHKALGELFFQTGDYLDVSIE